MSHNRKAVQGLDLPIAKLVPRYLRKVSRKYRDRIAASLRAVGLLEPFIVFPQVDRYEILDGSIRYSILVEMGVETVPCLIWHQREAFTGNRMVNQLSAAQEMRMLRKSLEELDEKTIAQAFGMSRIQHRVNSGLLKKLAPTVVKAFEAGLLNLQCAKDFTFVKPERQAEILQLMESCRDYSVTFLRGLILKTAVSKRAKVNGTTTPWTRAEAKKTELLKRLQEVEEQHDFYTGLYRQYTTNLLKMVIFVRSLVTNDAVRQYLQQSHPQELKLFNQIIDCTEQ
ncbi:MAG: ParB N-terminal domain-containing protein [Planctomycetaceae bacterium]|nr:ParB N-terminal domain-containing protein [Planctomycetaceae bacterium]